MNKLYIVRHGKTDWNVKGIMQGSKDIELNEEGINQAKELAEKIDLSKIDLCICSPLKRTRKTADIITKNKIEIIYDDMIIERGLGDYEGKPATHDLIVEQWNYKLEKNPNTGESVKEVLERAKQFLEKINKNYSNKTILIVSHGGFMKALHYNIMGYDENTDFLSFNPQNATVYEYEI